jgi:hypothetical protein
MGVLRLNDSVTTPTQGRKQISKSDAEHHITSPSGRYPNLVRCVTLILLSSLRPSSGYLSDMAQCIGHVNKLVRWGWYPTAGCCLFTRMNG